MGSSMMMRTPRPAQYSAFDLYTQLCYFRYLFDHERQRATLEKKREWQPADMRAVAVAAV
jgi:hypothetical protein